MINKLDAEIKSASAIPVKLLNFFQISLGVAQVPGIQSRVIRVKYIIGVNVEKYLLKLFYNAYKYSNWFKV